MDLNSLKIPDSQKENFKFFLNLPDKVRNEFIQVIHNVPLGLSESALYDYILDNVKNLSGEKISKLLSIYSNLSEAKDDLEYNDEEFILDLKNALKATGDPELEPNEDSMQIFYELFSSKININTSRIIEIEQLENDRNFQSSKISVDVRSVFDKDKFIGSTILNRLKITYRENDDEKHMFLALDDHDILELIETLKKAQDQNNYIKDNFNNLNIINITR